MKRVSRAEVIKRIDDLVSRLSADIDPTETECGWTPDATAGISQGLGRIREKVSAYEPAPEAAYLLRAVDHWGITAGGLYLELAALQQQITNLPKTTE